MHNPHRWIIGAGATRLVRDGHPNLMGCLRREPMKAEGRQQADDTTRHAFRSLHESMVLGHPAAVGDVESSSHLPHEPVVLRLAEIFPRDTQAIQLAWPEYPGLPDHAGYEFCLRNSHR